MTKIQALIKEERLTALVERLRMIGVGDLTITYAHGFSRAAAHFVVMRGRKYRVGFAPRLIVEWWGSDHRADSIVRAIERAAGTGQEGDGRIFISSCDEAFRFPRGEKGQDTF